MLKMPMSCATCKELYLTKPTNQKTNQSNISGLESLLLELATSFFSFSQVKPTREQGFELFSF